MPMAEQSMRPGDQALREDRSSGSPRQNHYTGVLIIHGLGAIKRNATLQEATDALTYWFNREAGLALLPSVPGRIWLTTALTADTNPDAHAARASMQIEVSDGQATVPQGTTSLQLEWREVWWAESLGLPSVGATLRWARVQAHEQAR